MDSVVCSYLDLSRQYKQLDHLELLPFTLEVLNVLETIPNLILLDTRGEKLDYLLENQEYELVQHTITYPSFILTSSTTQFGYLGDSVFFNRLIPYLDPNCWGMLQALTQLYIHQEIQRSGNFYFKYPLFSECHLDRYHNLTLHLTLNYYRPIRRN